MAEFYWEPTGRPGDFGPLSPWTLEQTEYRACTDTAVHCLPVVLQNRVIGYLWASRAEDAAGYVGRAAAGAAGFDAGGEWYRRMKQARQAGLSAWEAARLWTGEPEDRIAGAISDDAEVLVLPNSRAARRLAGRADGYERRS